VENDQNISGKNSLFLLPLHSGNVGPFQKGLMGVCIMYSKKFVFKVEIDVRMLSSKVM